jgi:hypothetical protein
MPVPVVPPESVVPPTPPGLVEPAVPPKSITASVVASRWDDPPDLLQAHPAATRQPIAQSAHIEGPRFMMTSLVSEGRTSVFPIAEAFRIVTLCLFVLACSDASQVP